MNKIHVVLHRVLEMAVRWDYLARNPADGIDKPKARKAEVQPPASEHLTRLIETAVEAGD